MPLSALLLVACLGEGADEPTPPGPRDDGVSGQDTGEDTGEEDTGEEDTGEEDTGEEDTGEEDTGEEDTGEETGPPGLQATLDDGTVLRGEVITTYDERLWWHPSDRDTVALFEADGWAEYPDDRSLAFVPDDAVAAWEDVSLPPGTPTWADLLWDEGVVIGGNPLATPTYVIMGNEGYHLEEDGFGDHAWDLVLTDDAGQRYTGVGAANTDFLVWDAPVYLPTDGVVVEVVHDAVDNRPGSYPEGAVNNLVGVWLGGQVYLYLLHFRQGTIPAAIRPGVALDAGAYLGRVGNSGVTLEPHLHLTLLYYDLDPRVPGAAPRTWSVPGEWADLWAADTPTGPAAELGRDRPETGWWIHDGPFGH